MNRTYLRHLVLLSLLSSCGKSSSGDGSDRQEPTPSDQPQTSSQIPDGQKEVFTFNSTVALGEGNIGCSTSGYGYAIDENLRKMAVCCVALSQVTDLDVPAQFITRSSDRIAIKGEKCEALILSGSIGKLALPVDIDVTSQRYLNLSGDKAVEQFKNVTGLVTISGSTTFETNLVGPIPLNLSGKSKIQNFHSLGTPIRYTLQDTAGFNDLQMSNIKIDGHGKLPGSLELSIGDTSTRATSGMSIKFENVKVTAEKANPVSLYGYPFDISGIEILPGKKYKPHVGFSGGYLESSGVLSETRYPILTSLVLYAGSRLTVSPGVKIKVPADAPGTAPFRGNNYAIILEGSDENHIVISSALDDSVGGDTNGDGSATKGSLFNLLLQQNGRWMSNSANVTMHHVDVYGLKMEVETENSKVLLGKVTFHPAQDGSTWRHLIEVASNGTNAKLTFDGVVEAWHPVETFMDNGKLNASGPILNSYHASIHGIEYLNVHNTSTSSTKIGQDVRAVVSTTDACKLTYDVNGQLTVQTKSWTYYVSDNLLKQCE